MKIILREVVISGDSVTENGVYLIKDCDSIQIERFASRIRVKVSAGSKDFFATLTCLNSEAAIEVEKDICYTFANENYIFANKDRTVSMIFDEGHIYRGKLCEFIFCENLPPIEDVAAVQRENLNKDGVE